MAKYLYLSEGKKGRFKASGVEFIVVKATYQRSTIRFRYETELREFDDSVLRAVAVGIDEWGEKEEP